MPMLGVIFLRHAGSLRGRRSRRSGRRFRFELAISDIHVELADLNQEATALAKKIQKNFDGLGI